MTKPSDISGATVRLRDNRLVILVCQLDDVLLGLADGVPEPIDRDAIIQHPARCAVCDSSVWWIDNNIACCTKCQPPSVEQRLAIWQQAHDFLGSRVDAAHAYLDFFDT